MEYKQIRISFRNGGDIVIPADSWDDYDYVNVFIVIKKDKAWIAMYNAEDIFSVVLEK